MIEQENYQPTASVKKTYEKPKLTKLGTVQELTKVGDDSNVIPDRGSS